MIDHDVIFWCFLLYFLPLCSYILPVWRFCNAYQSLFIGANFTEENIYFILVHLFSHLLLLPHTLLCVCLLSHSHQWINFEFPINLDQDWSAQRNQKGVKAWSFSLWGNHQPSTASMCCINEEYEVAYSLVAFLNCFHTGARSVVHSKNRES